MSITVKAYQSEAAVCGWCSTNWVASGTAEQRVHKTRRKDAAQKGPNCKLSASMRYASSRAPAHSDR